MEQTLSLIKPDGVRRGLIGNIISRFEGAGLQIRAMKMLHLTRDQARVFYAVHQERHFFARLVRFMTSGPIVAMILEGENALQVNRDLMGATDYRKAAPGTIRRDFARSIEKNLVHGSDSPETALTEIAFFFNDLEKV
jgi:nucleoside-diphosphate kinase